MKTKFFQTSNSWSPTVIRILLGSVLLAHGCQKALGWFGGYGFEGTMGFFTGTVGLPWLVAFLVILIEFIGSISVILGFATRLWSIAMLFLFLGIIFTSHIQNGFFMNWFGNQKGEGIEFFLLAIGMTVSLIISGAGRYSVDALLEDKKSFVKENALKQVVSTQTR
jgi:putative oxidoreductase